MNTQFVDDMMMYSNPREQYNYDVTDTVGQHKYNLYLPLFIKVLHVNYGMFCEHN